MKVRLFLLTPLREGRLFSVRAFEPSVSFLLTPLREGRLLRPHHWFLHWLFLLTPLREGRPGDQPLGHWHFLYFYSRPCGRGDSRQIPARSSFSRFLLTPLREGRPWSAA